MEMASEILKKCVEVSELLDKQKQIQDKKEASLKKREAEVEALAEETDKKISKLKDYENIQKRIDILDKTREENTALSKQIIREKAVLQKEKNELEPQFLKLRKDSEKLLEDKEALTKEWGKLNKEKEEYKAKIMSEVLAKFGGK